MQSNFSKQSCEFSADIVAYLYGESNAREISAFETHLAKCSNCADELAEFSNVHSAIENWRETEFDHLKTPEIVIPYHESSIKRAFAGEVKTSSFAGWRQIFDFGFAWKSATALATLAIFGLAILFVFESQKTDDAAGVTAPNSNIAETVLPKAAPIEIASNESDTPDEKTLPASATSNKNSAKVIPATARQSVVKVKNAVKPLEATVKTPKRINFSQSNVQTVADNSYKPVKSPHLLVDEDDNQDDSLRLSELFDETDKLN